jgi:hypothetical protein
MSTFHVLKYQISIPPTDEEFNALPKPILDIWMQGHIYSTSNDPINAAGMLRMWHFHGNDEAKAYVLTRIEELRKLLSEYEE